MSLKENKDYLLLIWKSEHNSRHYVVAQLSKNSHYEFKYCEEIKEALKVGFKPLVAMPDINEVYTSNCLFPTFESRLPDKKRKDIDKILEKYDMKEYEPYQLLKRSGARLPIDNLFFVDPIFDTSVPFKRVFYIAGSRHYIGCDGRDCNKSINILQGEQLILEREPNNFNDSNAVLVRNKNNQKIGHIPRYFSKSLSELLLNNRDYKCTVLNFDKYNNCNECIRVKLEIM